MRHISAALPIAVAPFTLQRRGADRRRDGSTFEIEQRITEDSLVSCPTTGQKVERVLQPFTPRYKGTGFYSTDHRKPRAKERPKGGGGT